MIEKIRMSAPCKINIHLRVRERRADGYHTIESMFQRISFADDISVSVTGPKDSCRLVSPLMELPAENTITRAVSGFRALTGIHSGLLVEINKNVPAGAGLGGGSSDAATTLMALNRLFDTRLSITDVTSIGLSIGSDVPFFLSGAAAVVEGRGEVITPCEGRSDLFGVLIWPELHSSTALGYRLVDEWRENGRLDEAHFPMASSLASMYAGPVSEWAFRNSFSAPLEAAYPIIGEAKKDLASCGGAYVEMSGSGSAVFGLFEDGKRSETAFTMLSARWKRCVKFLLLAS